MERRCAPETQFHPAVMAPPPTTNAGIVIDEKSGQRHIPESVRADGSTRKAIKIRPGYKPPEDIELYRTRNAKAARERAAQRAAGLIPAVPGAAPSVAPAAPVVSAAPATTVPGISRVAEEKKDPAATAAASSSSNKNAKRREARKKAKAAGEQDVENVSKESNKAVPEASPKAVEEVDPEVEKQKKARNLKKKLKQAKDLKNKKDEGAGLLPEQIAKVIKINELIRELDALGFDAEGEPKSESSKKEGEQSSSVKA